MVEEAETAWWDVLRVDVDVGETESAVDCGGGEEGEQADEEEAGEEEQGGEQHCSLEQLSVVLEMRQKGSRCENVEGESKKSVRDTITVEPTPNSVGAYREGDNDIDGQGDQSVEAEVSCHERKGGGSKHCMGGKEGHCFEHWEQFGWDLDLVIFQVPGSIIQVEGNVQVPFRAELGHRQEAGGETSDLEEAGCLVF